MKQCVQANEMYLISNTVFKSILKHSILFFIFFSFLITQNAYCLYHHLLCLSSYLYTFKEYKKGFGRTRCYGQTVSSKISRLSFFSA